MNPKLLVFLLSFLSVFSNSNAQEKLQGAWKSSEGVVIFAGDYFSYASFTATEFKYTYGGAWKTVEDKLILSYEYHTQDASKVGTTKESELSVAKKSLKIGEVEFSRLDNGNPGKLHGAWLFSNRIRNGELGKPRSADNPRKTLKILSGSRFQWIAYNTESKEFMGTGGGTYSTKGGKYTENIDFFSRDNSRVGASLAFEFELKENDWHHQGLSSKGDPIYEIWSLRE